MLELSHCHGLPKYVVKGKPKVILLGNWHPTNVTFCGYVKSNEARSAIGGRVWGAWSKGGSCPPFTQLISQDPLLGSVRGRPGYGEFCVLTGVGFLWPYFLALARDMEVREMFHSLVNKGGSFRLSKTGQFIVRSS